MKRNDISNICWVCRRTKKELDRPFDDAPDFKIPLREVQDMINYSGYCICDVCMSIIATIDDKYQVRNPERDGEHDLSAADERSGTGRRQASAKAQAEEHAGSNPAHPLLEPFISSSVLNPKHKPIRGMMKLPQAKVKDGKLLCKCGHWIGIVGTKWQHLGEAHNFIIDGICNIIDDTVPHKKQIKYREKCYHCDCATPTPAVV